MAVTRAQIRQDNCRWTGRCCGRNVDRRETRVLCVNGQSRCSRRTWKYEWYVRSTASARYAAIHQTSINPAKGLRCCLSHTLRNYAYLECVPFPQTTQIVACCTLGTRRIPRMCTFGLVAADTKRAAFQQLQGYISTRLKRFSGCDRVLLSRQSNENITISSFTFEQHRQALLVDLHGERV
jgi:hypothetical protein